MSDEPCNVVLYFGISCGGSFNLDSGGFLGSLLDSKVVVVCKL